MHIVKVLKRKDASSIAVAVAIAWFFVMWAPTMVGKLSGILSGVEDNQYYSYSVPGSDWKVAYLQPTIMFLLELVLLEVAIRLVVIFRRVLVRKRK